MKKKVILTLALVMLLGCLCGCGEPALLDPEKPLTLTMWHNYGGDMQSTMDLLIDEFNSTVGKEEGIIINVAAISSSAELNESLELIVNDDPGAPDIPDIFTGYPKLAMQFCQKDMLVNLDQYFTAEELENYIDAFVEEGRLSDGGLYVFPLAKSTEILFLNQTLFDRFAAETGADVALLETYEGIAQISRMYYDWTDAKTPDVPHDGKAFFTADSWFNTVEVGMKQLGRDIFIDEETLAMNDPAHFHIFNTFFTPAVEGGVAVYDGYSSDLAKTGDLVCSTGSSAGILFYGDTITYPDGTIEDVTYSILPYPVWEGGEKVALQRGGGLMVAKSTEQREYAAAVFLKWLTAAQPNMDFVSKTGYLPVTKEAFEELMPQQITEIEDVRIRKMLEAVMAMYEEYSFFYAPNYSQFDALSNEYEETFKTLLTTQRGGYLAGEDVSAEAALNGVN